MTEAQSVTLVIASCFCLIYGVSNLRTYKVLAVMYFVNALVHWLFSTVPSYSSWWPALYSTLDLCALVAIASIGDARVKFNMACLGALILAHGFLAPDLIFGSNTVFSFYYQVVLTIIALQITAGFWDAATEYRRSNNTGNSTRKYYHHVKNHHKGATP